MNIDKILNPVLIILRNYNKLIKNIAIFFLFTFIISASGVIITIPLWYMATKHSTLFTWSVLLIISALSAVFAIRRVMRWAGGKMDEGLNSFQIILVPLRKFSIYISFLTGLYLILLVFAKGFILIGIVLTVFYIMILGYFIFIRYNFKNR